MEWNRKKDKTWVEHNFAFIIRVDYADCTETSSDGYLIIRRDIWTWLGDEVGKVHDWEHGWGWDRDEDNAEMVFGFASESNAVLFKLVWGIE